jgi:hypothetical protein
MTHSGLLARQAPAATVTDSLTFDEQWARWQEKGARHDARVRRKVRLVAAVAMLIAFVWALLSLW